MCPPLEAWSFLRSIFTQALKGTAAFSVAASSNADTLPHALQLRLLYFHFVLPASTTIWPVLSAPVAVYWCGIPSSCNPESSEGIRSRESHLLVLSQIVEQQSCLVHNRNTRASSYRVRSQNLVVLGVNQWVPWSSPSQAVVEHPLRSGMVLLAAGIARIMREQLFFGEAFLVFPLDSA